MLACCLQRRRDSVVSTVRRLTSNALIFYECVVLYGFGTLSVWLKEGARVEGVLEQGEFGTMRKGACRRRKMCDDGR